MAFVVRSDRAGTASLINEIRQAVWSVNGDVPIALERTMQDLYADSLARTSFALVMLAIAGCMALALGIIGIYGVIAYVVSQTVAGDRDSDGARRRAAARFEAMFLRQGLALSARRARDRARGRGRAGDARCLRCCSASSPTDPATYVAALGVILAAAALASYLPARRASAIDPVETLKAE